MNDLCLVTFTIKLIQLSCSHIKTQFYPDQLVICLIVLIVKIRGLEPTAVHRGTATTLVDKNIRSNRFNF